MASSSAKAAQLVLSLQSSDDPQKLQVRQMRALSLLQAPAALGVQIGSIRHHARCLPTPGPAHRDCRHRPLTSASRPSPTLAQALRDIKNSLIGNRRQKIHYLHLGAVPLLVGVLAAPSSTADQRVQASAALGSLAACEEEGVRALLQHGAVPHLLHVLLSSCSSSSSDGATQGAEQQQQQRQRVAEAAVRALKAVCRVSLVPAVKNSLWGRCMPLALGWRSDFTAASAALPTTHRPPSFPAPDTCPRSHH